jgi:hypothetical protein
MKGFVPVIALAALALAACGGSRSSTSSTAQVPERTTTSVNSAATTTSGTSPDPLQPEAGSAAAGDIPDNQTFLVFHNGAAGYAMKYPEGWAQRGSAGLVTFRDKNNIVRVIVTRGAVPTTAGVRAEMRALGGAALVGAPHAVALGGGPAIKVTYNTVGSTNAVTGKRVKLVVDRYYLWKRGRRAVVDLGTPVGVDNVDAYRLMIESFRWS